MKMRTSDVIDLLDQNNDVVESYVFQQEIKLFLNVGHESFQPMIRVKIYKSSVFTNTPYHFDVSHHIQTPLQAAVYCTAITSFRSEAEAIGQAISTTMSFIKAAIRKGHEASDDWLIPNHDF